MRQSRVVVDLVQPQAVAAECQRGDGVTQVPAQANLSSSSLPALACSRQSEPICSGSEAKARRHGIAMKHLDGIKRIFSKVLADQRQLFEDVRCNGNDMAADLPDR